MAKLLIVEDHLRMVQMIQKYLCKINPQFTPENTFCFSPQTPLMLRSLSEIENFRTRALLTGKKDAVFSKVFQFLDERPDEIVLILIDVLLNTQKISAPSIEQYQADHEYSCELYAELLRAKNGKPIQGCANLNPKNFFHIIYSRSDASIGVVTTVLDELSSSQSEQDQKYFPKECAKFENISWCLNGYDTTDPDFGVAESQKEDSVPLKLPSEYREFIRDMK